MNKENLHRLLKRQIKEHFGSLEKIPEELDSFLNSVNAAYKDYDKDLSHTENILKISSQELFKANKELKTLNEQNVKIIDERTKDLKRLAYNLQNAEKIALLGNFSIDLFSETITVSDQLNNLLNFTSGNTYQLDDFFNLFENGSHLIAIVTEAIRSGKKVSAEELRLKNDQRFFILEGQVFAGDSTQVEQFFLGVIQDVTLAKKHEISLYDSLQLIENYKKAIDQAGIVSITDNKGIITYVNGKFCEISGFSEEELLGSQHNVVNSGFHDKKYFVQMWKTISTGKVWKGVIRNKSKSGKYYWVDSTIVPFMKNGRVDQYFSIRFDITEKMLIHEKVEEQRNFYEGILNNIPVDIAVFDLNHNYLFVNPIGVKNPEVREFLIGRDDFDYCKKFGKSISIAQMRRELFNKVKEQKVMNEFIDESLDKNGKTNYHLRRFFPVKNAKDEVNYLIGFGINITEKMEQELKIKNSLEEKEALLGEVHHRVKNNLALVMGLIELQSAKSEDTKSKLEFNEIQNRISAMALIHEKLYKSQDFAKIELGEYIQDLIKFLHGFYNKGNDVKVIYDMEKIHVSTKVAVPLALITNELVTNAFKYALNGKGAELRVKMVKMDSDLYYEIADNGPGLKEIIDPLKSKSLGFKLLNIFVKQLKGKYELKNEGGLHVCIRFKNEQKNINS